ncbi:MAG: sulfite exporter TauE/SafE family protein [Granulosicoccus sp.]
MNLPELSLLAVFLTGLLGGVHCAGMCGGIVSALGMMRQKVHAAPLEVPVSVVHLSTGAPAVSTPALPGIFSAVCLYNLGRIGTYTILGAIAGGVGSVAWLMQSLLPVQQIAFFTSNVLLILMGLYVLGFKRIGVLVESLGKRLWIHIKPLANARLGGSGATNSLLAGSLWGLVPCGMVYAVLSAALVSGAASKGALLMFVFGLGTLPNLMVLGISGQWLARATRNRYVRLFAGGLVVAFGLIGLTHLLRMLLLS